MFDARPPTRHGRSAPAKPVAAMRNRSVAAKGLVSNTPKKMAVEHGRSAPAKPVAAMSDRIVAARALVSNTPKKIAVESMSTTLKKMAMEHGWSASAKPVAEMRNRSVAAKALISNTSKKMVVEHGWFALAKPIASMRNKSNKGGISDVSTSAIVKEQLLSSDSPSTPTLKVSVLSVIPNSLCSTNPDSQKISEASMRNRSVAAKALVSNTPKKIAVEPMPTTCARKQSRKKWTDMLKSNKGGISDFSTSAIVKEQLLSSDSPGTPTLKVSVLSVIPNSLCSTNSDSQKISEASMRNRSVAAKAPVSNTPKKIAVEPMSTTCARKKPRKKWTDCPMLKSIKGGISNVLSVIPNSLCYTNPDSQKISKAFGVHASCQGHEIEVGVNTSKLDDNKENIPSTKSLEVNFEKSVEVSVIHSSCQGSETITEVDDAMSLKENCEKPNIIKKSIEEPSKTLHLKQHGHAEKSKRTTKPKPFRLLTNERGTRGEPNLESKQKLEAPKQKLEEPNGVKSEAKTAQSRNVHFAGKLITTLCSKMSSRNAQSSSQHQNEVVTDNATSSQGRRLAATIQKGPCSHKIHTPKDCVKKPLKWR